MITVYRLNKYFKLFCIFTSLIVMFYLTDINTSILLSMIYFLMVVLDLVYCLVLSRISIVKFVPSMKTVIKQLVPYIICILFTDAVIV